MGKQPYRTKQRLSIMQYLLEHNQEHLTAEDIVVYLRQQGNRVGKATVYRYLDYLVNEGSVRRYILDDNGAACYQYIEGGHACHDHLHLKCHACGTLFHVDFPLLATVERGVEQEYGFTIDHTKTVLYGTCDSCRQKGEVEI